MCVKPSRLTCAASNGASSPYVSTRFSSPRIHDARCTSYTFIGSRTGSASERRAIHAPSAHSWCPRRSTIDACPGDCSILAANGSVLMRRRPLGDRISNLYNVPASTPGTKISKTPLAPSIRITCTRPSQPLNMPITDTRVAFGAQTANDVPATPSITRGCAPSFSQRRR